MSLTSITCPECGAGLKSAVGFTPGQAARCSKCETDFTVREDGDDADAFEPKSKQPAAGEEWSYKNSWIRYAVLGGLLVVLGVLAYMLYEKRTKGDVAKSDNDDGDEARVIEPKMHGDPPLPVQRMMPAGGGGGPVGPRVKQLSMKEVNELLVGRWEAKTNNGMYSVEYTEGGSFTYVGEKNGQPKKTAQGKWAVKNVGPTGNGPQGPIVNFQVEWTIEGGSNVVRNGVGFNGNDALTHPLLTGESGESAPFTRKK